MTTFGKLYLGNKMGGVPYFNAPWFDNTAKYLRTIPGVHEVFNPADHDRETGFDPMSCPGGSPEEAIAAGFSIRDALAYDWDWIADKSDGLIVGPQWADSKGTISEIAAHQAIGLPVWRYEIFVSHWWFADILTSDWTLSPLGKYLG